MALSRTRGSILLAAAVLTASMIVALAAMTVPSSAAPYPGYGTTPIPGTDTHPDVVGKTVVAEGLAFEQVPQHPYLAKGDVSNTHLNAYQTDATTFTGPSGNAPSVSSVFLAGESGTQTFDSFGHLVTVVITPIRNVLTVFDPTTMAVLSTFEFPIAQGVLDSGGSTNVGGGAYFYLDERDRAMVSTRDGEIYAVGIRADGSSFLDRKVDVSGFLAEGDEAHSTMPDWTGRIWFTTGNGIVGAISGFDNNSPDVRTRDLGEPIKKSFAADSDGSMSIVTDAALYRFVADETGMPTPDWRAEYPNDGVKKPGKLSAGAGSTPTLLNEGWVATTDNADPVNVVVYRRGAKVAGGGEEICRVPVFEKGASASFQSLTWGGGQLLVENNYGYTGIESTVGGKTTVPGLTAIAFDTETEKCTVKWTNTEVSSPSAIPRLSLGNGIVYTVSKPYRADHVDDWYLTALDWRTGTTVFSVRYGSGVLMNNNFTAVTLGPDGTAYIGVAGGLVRISDTHH